MRKLHFHLPHVSLRLLFAGLVAVAVPGLALAAPAATSGTMQRVVIPDSDQFGTFALTIHVGDSVQWVNTDTDNHTVVSDDAVNSAGPWGFNHIIPGTDNNNGHPGTFSVRFDSPGVWVYYCRFHSHLSDSHQPTAPGPDGGIQDSNGNFGTPMSGVITVLP